MNANIQLSTNLVEINNQSIFTTSNKVADVFGKNHRDVLRDIDKLIHGINEINTSEGMRNFAHTPFKEVVVINQQNNQEYRSFELNRDGFALLAMGYTGKEALKFKIAYINQFNAMEQQLSQKQINHVEAQGMLIKQLEGSSSAWKQKHDLINKAFKELNGHIDQMILGGNLPLTPSQQKEMQLAIHQKVEYLCERNKYKKNVAYHYVWGKIKKYMDVPIYRYIERNRFDEGMTFIKNITKNQFIKDCPHAKVIKVESRQLDLFNQNQVVTDLKESIQLLNLSDSNAIKPIIIGKIERSIDKLNSLGFNKAQQITIN